MGQAGGGGITFIRAWWLSHANKRAGTGYGCNSIHARPAVETQVAAARFTSDRTIDSSVFGRTLAFVIGPGPGRAEAILAGVGGAGGFNFDTNVTWWGIRGVPGSKPRRTFASGRVVPGGGGRRVVNAGRAEGIVNGDRTGVEEIIVVISLPSGVTHRYRGLFIAS